MTKFDPTPHLMKLQGKDYLPVAARLHWLRTEQPDAVIVTELVELRADFALAKATVTLSNGASSTDYGSETPKDFKDYIEKSLTKAIGRALGSLGFGTQFCNDHEDGATIDRPVDAPQRPRQAAPRPAPAKPPTGIEPNAPTQAQKDERNRLAKALGMSGDDLRDFASVMFDGRKLTAADTDKLNAQLQRELDIRNADPDTGEVIGAEPAQDADDVESVGIITDITHAMDKAETFDALREIQADALVKGVSFEPVVVSAYSRNYERFHGAG